MQLHVILLYFHTFRPISTHLRRCRDHAWGIGKQKARVSIYAVDCWSLTSTVTVVHSSQVQVNSATHRIRFTMWAASVITISALLCACVTHTRPSQDRAPESLPLPPADLPDSYQSASQLLSTYDRPLQAYAMMERVVAKGASEFRQPLAQFSTMLGDEKTALILERTAFRLPANPKPAKFDPIPGQRIDTLDAISAAAHGKRVVILQESHFRQRHRAFAHLLALRLRKEGFTHLGAEAFNNCAKLPQNKSDAPHLQLGFYTADPLFGDLVRNALSAGYSLFCYEQTILQQAPADADWKAGIAARESAQAGNIKKILDENPNARLFIYAGGSHGLKVPDGVGNEWMGMRLAKLAGIDPLVIEQSVGTPSLSAEHDLPFRRSVEHLESGSAAYVVRQPNGEFVTQRGYDISVFHPRVPDVGERGGWMTMNGYRSPVEFQFAPRAERSLIRAHFTKEPHDAVAVDQILIPAGNSKATLILPRGEYRITRQFESGYSEALGLSLVHP